MSDEAREAIEAAYDAAVEEAEEQEATDEVEVENESEEIDAADDEEESEVLAEGDDGGVDDVRDDAEEVDKVDAEQSVDESVSEADVEETPKSDDVAAPQSWRPAAREAWGNVPKEAQEEISRLEHDFQKKLGEMSDNTRQARAFQEAVKPFEQTIAIEAGGDAMAATRNLMGIATRLRFGSGQEKAQLVSDIVNQYGIDIDMLDNALSGGARPFEAQQPQHQAPPMQDPRVEQMWQQQQQAAQQNVQGHQQEVAAFMGDPANEWAADVRDDMADVMDFASRRNETLTLKEAYDRAVMMRPDLQKIVHSRTQAIQNPQESLRRKKRASKAIKGSPSSGGGGSKGPQTRESALHDAWDTVASGNG